MTDTGQTRGLDRRAFLQRAAAGIAVLGLGVPALGRRAQEGAGRVVDSPFDWTEIRPGVYATSNVATGGNCLAFRADGGGGRCLLVDTKFPAFAPRIARDVEALTGLAPTHVVNTHHHGDHTGGNMHFTGSGSGGTAAVVIAQANNPARVRRQLGSYMSGVTGGVRTVRQLPEQYRDEMIADAEGLLAHADAYEAEDWVPTTTVDTRAGLDMGGEWVELIHFGRPSHTDNDLVVHFAGRNVVHTGDIVFNGLHPYFDANGGTSSTGWIETLTDLEKRCDETTIVVPGHGQAGGVEIVRAQRRYIEQLRDAVQKGIDAGTPIDELKTETFPFMEGMGFDRLRENAIVFVHGELTSDR